MAKETAGGLQGALDLLILRTLESCGRMHGYGITLHIQSRSDNLLRIEEGSLYPALHRTEQAGAIKAVAKTTAAPGFTASPRRADANWRSNRKTG